MWNLVDPSDSDSQQNKMLQYWCLSQVVWVCEHVPKIDTNLVLWQKIQSGIVHWNHKSLGQQKLLAQCHTPPPPTRVSSELKHDCNAFGTAVEGDTNFPITACNLFGTIISKIQKVRS